MQEPTSSHERHRSLDAAIEEICRRHGIHELAAFGAATGSDSQAPGALNLLVEFESETPIGFADLMDIQDELAQAFGHRVFLVPRQNLGSGLAQIGSQVRMVYSAGPRQPRPR